MNLSLDYDGTYTRDPGTWDRVIQVFREAGHKVYVVTMRRDVLQESEEVKYQLHDKVDGIFFTGRLAKQPFMFSKGISIDVWIDDMPFFVNTNAAC